MTDSNTYFSLTKQTNINIYSPSLANLNLLNIIHDSVMIAVNDTVCRPYLFLALFFNVITVRPEWFWVKKTEHWKQK